jgi:aspartate aminotransferase
MSTTAAPGLADGIGRLGTETAFSVLARAKALEREGRDVIHLEIGEPDFGTAAHICEAAAAAMRAGETHYCPSAGIPELREVAAEFLSRTRGIDVRPANVLVGTGAKPFLFFTILATCNPGDEVIYPDPGFPIYESAIRWAGATPVPLPLLEERDFTFDPNDLAARLSDRTKLVILNSPHNPTGGAMSPEDAAGAAELLAGSSSWVLSDEVYSQLLYDGEFASVASTEGMLERTILLDGLSKAYAMTGWRCGFAAVPDALVDPLTRFFVNSTSCVPPFVQLAGVAALTGPQHQVQAMLEELRVRRDLVVSGLNELSGISCRTPRGAFYAFPNVAEVPIGAERLADRLLDEAGVALLAGTAFGQVGKANLRISYANSRENLARALERIRAFLAAL